MLQFPKNISDQNFQKTLVLIESLATTYQYLPLSRREKEKIIHLETLKSSLFSARIEGNNLTLIQASRANLQNPQKKSKLELSNLLKAQRLLARHNQPLEKKDILQIHQTVMANLASTAGKFRYESSAIFDGLGNIVYLTPDPNEMQTMLAVLLEKFNPLLAWKKALINTALCHYYFEKIHPFIDGNGRVGRILLKHQLLNIDLLPDLPLPIEEYFEKHRSDYYFFLEKNTTNLEKFVEFFLQGIAWSLKKVLTDVKKIKQTANQQTQTVNLLPRREEIFHIIQNHPYINLDSIARRFPTIPKRTIAYDVNQLIKKKLVNKHGKTRGVCYSARE